MAKMMFLKFLLGPSSRKRHVSSEAIKTLQSGSNTEETETVLQEIISQSPDEVDENDDNLLDMSVDHLSDEGLCDNSIGSGITSSKEQKDVGIQNAVVMFDSAVQTYTMVKEDAEVQAIVSTEEASTDINTGLLNIARHVGTTTDDLNVPATQFSIESVKHYDKTILYYTGFTFTNML